ncbi:hypothetical protein M406DRAFT_269494 [Cryphonectria parasitica EP155]|uniref:Uncharacterized protein n=1 Tax=Cryphonectria parasitica (strain ATCC 38755 / EP155) TaxID=660469 RepID=A0A9P5CJP7_CRYP1|nr:uncharacterized protein M406DRAFT_269494 [Cryphonectria parasitica EP155]KAF3760146.1 hypothetical protein M406DRAFT_269494 [Cryphonectria parasitica EP155]
MSASESNREIVTYEVDPSKNPAAWGPGPVPKGMVIYKVDVIFININAGSDFTIMRTGTNESVHTAITQVTKHIARGFYRVVSLQASEYSCVVVVSTQKSQEDLERKGFPWDVEGAYDDEPVVLK